MTESSTIGPPPDVAFESPSASVRVNANDRRILVIGCGALARELVALRKLNSWSHMDITCLPAIWHNHPERIADGVRRKVRAAKAAGDYAEILVAFGDCGTGGQLDKVLEEEGVVRLDGAHCYAFFTGVDVFTRQAEDDMTSFFLTDYLARHFDTLIWRGFGIDKHPELRDMLFAHYTRVVYLAQTDDAELNRLAENAAHKLSLAYERRETGYGELASFLARSAADENAAS